MDWVLGMWFPMWHFHTQIPDITWVYGYHMGFHIYHMDWVLGMWYPMWHFHTQIPLEPIGVDKYRQYTNPGYHMGIRISHGISHISYGLSTRCPYGLSTRIFPCDIFIWFQVDLSARPASLVPIGGNRNRPYTKWFVMTWIDNTQSDVCIVYDYRSLL